MSLLLRNCGATVGNFYIVSHSAELAFPPSLLFYLFIECIILFTFLSSLSYVQFHQSFLIPFYFSVIFLLSLFAELLSISPIIFLLSSAAYLLDKMQCSYHIIIVIDKNILIVTDTIPASTTQTLPHTAATHCGPANGDTCMCSACDCVRRIWALSSHFLNLATLTQSTSMMTSTV